MVETVIDDVVAGTEPLVSVCIPTYQHANYIGECLESVLCQKTNFRFEVLLGEDDSTDGTREICMEYANKYPDSIRLFLRSRKDVVYVDGFPTGRYNFLETLSAARGRYIAFCDGDDYWTDDRKLQTQVDYLEQHPDLVLCHHWHDIAAMNDVGEFIRKPAPTTGHGYYPVDNASISDVFANRLRVKLRTVMFRNVLRTYPPWIWKVAFGDVPLTMLLGKHGQFGFINKSMAVYRLTGRGVSTQGASDRLFIYRHYTQWITIWEYGNQFYDGRYEGEVVTTIRHFYEIILQKYRFVPSVYLRLVCFVAFRSRCRVFVKVSLVAQIIQFVWVSLRERLSK